MHGAGEHGRMLPGAIVVQPRRPLPTLSRQTRTATRQWLVRSAGEIALLEPESLEHARGNSHVLWLTPVRRTREGQLFDAPAERVESATAEQRHHLKRLGA
jgi:hypothetical protein